MGMSKRKTTVVPEKQPLKLKPPPSTGDDFTDSCFILDVSPCLDDRTGSRMDGLKEVPGLVQQGLLEEAWVILDKHHQTIKDLDFIYAFKALILQKNGQSEAAKKTLLAGLKYGRGKFLLYARLGFLSFETGQLSEAVNWWIKSVVAMVMLNRVTMWEPFLYLAYVAKALSSEIHFRNFMAFVTKISPHGELGLDDNALQRLNEQAPGLLAPSILKAMDVLCLHFLHKPADQPGPTFPGTHPPGHPNVPATTDPLFAFNRLFGEKKRSPWIFRLAMTVLALALILFFLQFLTSPKPEPGIKGATALPETGRHQGPVEETKNSPSTSGSQDPIVPVLTGKSPAVESLPKKVTPDVDPVKNPIPHKGKSSFLKSKTKKPSLLSVT